MLVLTRKLHEVIRIGNDIKIKLLNVDRLRNEVSIGVDAPKHVEIHREEIFQRIQTQRDELAQNTYLFEITYDAGNVISIPQAHHFETMHVAALDEKSAITLLPENTKDYEISVIWSPEQVRRNPKTQNFIYQQLRKAILNGQPLPFYAHYNPADDIEPAQAA